MARTFVIGDVHGCIDELDRLLERFALVRGDEVLLVGDLVNKGPESVQVVRRCREIGARAVVGNHDDLLLRCIAARREGDDDEFPDLVRHIARKLSEDDAAWLAALPGYIPLPAHEAVVTHAGMKPNVRPERQDPKHLMTTRSIRADGTPSKRIDEGVPWASLWTGPSHVVFGHDAVRGLQQWPYATGIDTACVYGGRLTALELGERRLVSVPARKAYAEPGRALEGRK